MTTTAAVVLALVLAALLLAALGKPVKRAVLGLISTDRKGRTTLVIWPASKKKGKRRK